MIVCLLQQVDMKIKQLKIFEMHFVALATSTVLVKLQKLTGLFKNNTFIYISQSLAAGHHKLVAH